MLLAILYAGYSRVRFDGLDITSVPSGYVPKVAKLVSNDPFIIITEHTKLMRKIIESISNFLSVNYQSVNYEDDELIFSFTDSRTSSYHWKLLASVRYCYLKNRYFYLFKTGMRPFIDPRTEPLTVIMNGMTDNRFYLQQETRQFTISAPQSNLNELVRPLAQKRNNGKWR